MIQETREIEQTLQSHLRVRAYQCLRFFFYTRKLRCNSRSNEKTPVLIGGSGAKQYLICLGQSSPLHFATEGAFTNQGWSAGFFFFLRLRHRAPPGECSRTTALNNTGTFFT